MGLIQYAFLSMFLLIIGAGGAAMLVQSSRKKLLLDLLAFSGAYLFGILVMELLPVIFFKGERLAGILFLLGFFVQLGMDFWTRGIEHGHLHIPSLDQKAVIFSLFAGLGLHAVMDGLPFVGMHSPELESHHSIYSGILLHKIAEGFTLLLVLGMMGVAKIKSWIFIISFSLITPLSILIIHQIPILLNHISLVMGFAGGSLLHVSITILFESENLHHHGIPIRKLGSIALGLILAILIAMA